VREREGGDLVKGDKMTWQVEPSGQRIVVGVDGSPSSKAALKWAVRQAALTGSTVEAVIAWHFPPMYGGYGVVPVSAVEPANFDEIAAKALNEAVAEVVDPASSVRISTTVAEGNPAQVLLDAAEGADLLVVGSRGHGGFTGALLGSVSQHCAGHSPCPVVIIRGKGA
jgi:nucleotide-binding universal stress UspA family protein